MEHFNFMSQLIFYQEILQANVIRISCKESSVEIEVNICMQ